MKVVLGKRRAGVVYQEGVSLDGRTYGMADNSEASVAQVSPREAERII